MDSLSPGRFRDLIRPADTFPFVLDQLSIATIEGWWLASWAFSAPWPRTLIALRGTDNIL